MSGQTTTATNPNGATTGKLRYPVMLELLVLGGIVVVLIVTLSMIRSLVMERARRSESVRHEIASSWGLSQSVMGPVVTVPYRVHSIDANGKTHVSTNQARFLPETLAVTGTLSPERRHRGIFETVIYRADLQMSGSFSRPDFSRWEVAPQDILWDQAIINVGITDLRGLRGQPIMKWSGSDIAFKSGGSDPLLFGSGFSHPVPLPPEPVANESYPFRLALQLNGSQQIGFVPLGRITTVAVQSSWPDPSFGGAFLPESRSISDRGFTARWHVNSIARSYAQQWLDSPAGTTPEAMRQSAFHVALFSPIDHYQQTERAIKYGLLFIVLTFMTFFLYELMSPTMLHPVQYFLVGGALCLFYLLLLSISEHAEFLFAYVIGSVATIALISAYASALLRSRSRTWGLAGVLTLLYGYLYVLLQLEDWALLTGSIGLFVILALVMYLTRRIDWGAVHQRPSTAASIDVS